MSFPSNVKKSPGKNTAPFSCPLLTEAKAWRFAILFWLPSQPPQWLLSDICFLNSCICVCIYIFPEFESAEKMCIHPKPAPSIPVETSQPLTTQELQAKEDSGEKVWSKVSIVNNVLWIKSSRVPVGFCVSALFFYIDISLLYWSGSGECGWLSSCDTFSVSFSKVLFSSQKQS